MISFSDKVTCLLAKAKGCNTMQICHDVKIHPGRKHQLLGFIFNSSVCKEVVF